MDEELDEELDEEVEIQMGNYTFTEKYCVGQGSFGKVYRGKNTKTNKQVAIKQMDGKLISEQQITMEIAILKQLKHPNIVQYQDAFQNGGYFYIVTEYCQGGDLRNIIEDSDGEGEERDKEKIVIEMFRQVCEGFCYLKQFNIIHRDLKPSNILLHNGVYKISDFGLAKRQIVHKSVMYAIHQHSHKDLVGVPIYMSPQILSKNYYTYKCDVWSIGIIVFQMLFEHLPWKSIDIQGLFFQIMNHPEPYKEKNGVKPIFMEIFNKTLRYLEKQRGSWEQLIALSQGLYKPEKKAKQLDKPEQTASSVINPLSLSRCNPKISKQELQILNHILSQAKSLQTQLLQLSNKQSLKALFSTLHRYLSEGPDMKGMLMDCIFIFLRMLINNLYLQLMQYESMQDARSLLIFLQLLHDYILSGHRKGVASFQVIFSNSLRARDISEYAASVISKINTLLIYQGVTQQQ